jgi:hypothetical protein
MVAAAARAAAQRSSNVTTVLLLGSVGGFNGDGHAANAPSPAATAAQLADIASMEQKSSGREMHRDATNAPSPAAAAPFINTPHKHTTINSLRRHASQDKTTINYLEETQRVVRWEGRPRGGILYQPSWLMMQSIMWS